MATGTIAKKYGNTIYYFVTQKVEGETYIYQQIPKSEVTRIESNTYKETINGQIENIEGTVYTDTLSGKDYAFIGFYDTNGIYQSTALSLTESQYGTVSNSINNDSDLKKLVVGSSNTSTTNPNQPSPTGGSSTPITEPNKQPASPGGALIYPNDLAQTEQDRIKFQALTYASKTLPSQGFESIKPTYQNAQGQGAIYLPIQAAISDQNAVSWEPDTLNPIEKYAIGLSKRIMEDPRADITATLNKNFQNAKEDIKALPAEAGAGFRTWLAGQAVGVNNLNSRINGQVLNPNLELLFQGPQLRPFSFTFKLSPRNDKEAVTVKQIIRYFKRNMSPIVGDQGLFIKAPNIFKIEYQYGDPKTKTLVTHQGINLIKECALTNCSVDYTPLGSYMTYPEGTMVSYTMSLQFQEIEPIYSRDYDQLEPGKSHSIGY